MQAMIFAAGLGTRLRPITDTRPKALVEVKGSPLLDRVVEKLSSSGFHDIVINTHHFAEMIKKHVEENHNFGQNIKISDESQMLLDTGGAVKKAHSLLNGREPLLIHNVDIISNADLADLYNSTMDKDALLLVSYRQTSRYLIFNEEMRLVGWTNIKTHELKTPYKNLDIEKCRLLAFSGIHCISESLMNAMQSWPERFSIIDFYLQNCDRFKIYGHQQEGLKLLDIGKTDILNSINSGAEELPC